MRSSCCLCLRIHPLDFWMPEPVFKKRRMNITAPTPISTAYFINSCKSVCLHAYPLTVARHRLGNHVSVATNICKNRKTVRHVVFYTVRVPSKESLWVRVFPAVVWRLSEPSYSKIWSWVPWDWELRIIMLARASSNLLDWTGLCIPLPLLGNGSVNMFPRQTGIVGDIVFYAVCVVSKEGWLLVLTRNSCYLFHLTLTHQSYAPSLHASLWSMRNRVSVVFSRTYRTETFHEDSWL
jgi:hypothetical protein